MGRRGARPDKRACEQLGALAAVQGGVVLVGQAVERGWERGRLDRYLRAEGWTRVHRGAWAEPGRPVDTVVRLWAVQVGRPELAVSHTSAALVHGIEQRGAEAIEFTGPYGARSAAAEGKVHRLRLGPHEVVARAGGLRVTTVARTLADLLRAGPRDEALVAVESALGWRPSQVAGVSGRRGPLVTLGAVARAVEESGTPPGMWGTKAARERLRLVDPRAGSPAETIARLRMYDAGLHPESQVLIVTGSGRRVYPDFLFRAQGLVVEIEGYLWHGSRAQHQRDLARFNDLMACPEVRCVLRFTANDVYQRPDAMVRDIRAALARP